MSELKKPLITECEWPKCPECGADCEVRWIPKENSWSWMVACSYRVMHPDMYADNREEALSLYLQEHGPKPLPVPEGCMGSASAVESRRATGDNTRTLLAWEVCAWERESRQIFYKVMARTRPEAEALWRKMFEKEPA